MPRHERSLPSLVRHHIYLGVALLATDEALASGSWPALVVALAGIVPTFVWRARAEGKLLGRAFGERYAVYRRRTKMIIPHLLRGTDGISVPPTSSDRRSFCRVWRCEAAMEPDREAFVQVAASLPLLAAVVLLLLRDVPVLH